MMGRNFKSSKRAINSLILVLLWILFSNVFLSAEKLLIDEVVESAVPCIVRINAYDKIGDLSCGGSGFFIGPGKILTCAHVMEDAYSAQVISNLRQYNRVKILKMDEYKDLALLMIDASGEKSLQLENEQVPIRDQYLIAVAHNFANQKKAVSYGIVHTVVSNGEKQDIINSAPIFSGWSGGPLLNLEGHVIGIHKQAWGDGPRVAVSTGFEAIKKFLERPNNPKDLAYAGSIVFWSVISGKLGEFWRSILEWIDYQPLDISDFLFSHGFLRGIYIIILTGILIGWRSPFLLRSVRARKKGKALNRIIKWSDGDNSLEIGSVLETRDKKGKYHIFY